MSEVSEASIERRQHFRIDMEEEMVDITWQDANGEEQTERIQCLDFSRGGLRVDCEYDIPVHSEATVIFQAADPKSQRLYCRVLRSLKQPNGFFQIALKLTH